MMAVEIAMPATMMPTAIRSCLLKLTSSRASQASEAGIESIEVGVDLLEAGLHGVEQTVEGTLRHGGYPA